MKKESDVVKKDGDAGSGHGFVPPPPSAGVKFPPPAGMPAVKLFPIGGSPPATMSFPGLAAATVEAGAP